MMKPYDRIAEVIEQQAAHIASELIDIRFYEVGRLASQISVRLKQAINASLSVFQQLEEEEIARIKVDKQLSKREMDIQLQKHNKQLKDVKRAVHLVRSWDEYLLLKRFVREKYGQHALDEFYEAVKNNG